MILSFAFVKLGIQAHGPQYLYTFDDLFHWSRKSVRVLLFWKIGHRKLRENGRHFVRMQLANVARSYAEAFHSNDRKYAETSHLSWIRSGRFEFGNFYPGKKMFCTNL